MNITILFPCEYDNINQVDEEYQLEFNACETLDIQTNLFDHDLFIRDDKLILKQTLNPDKNSEILLRSWMLTKKQYYSLNSKVDNKLFTNHFQYGYAHHFPEILQDIKQYTTPVNCWFHLDDMNDDLIEAVQDGITTNIIIKDYVKSEKGTDLFIIPKQLAKTQLKDIIERFVEQRQPLFNEGIVLKEFVDLKKYNGITNEWRAFFWEQKLITLQLNSEQDFNGNKPELDFVKEVGTNITRSKFYSIDFAELEDGSWKVLEAGDGQVSGLATFQNELVFYSILKEYL
jgi:hypothetical protein